MSRVLVLGAGGHAKVVADILLCQGLDVLGFLDDDPATWGTECLSLKVLGAVRNLGRYAPCKLVMGIGSNQSRQRIVGQLGTDATDLWINAIHPRATLAASVRLGIGAVIAAGVIINPDTVLGNHVIINTGATVDHDCRIGDYVHIAPGTHLAGGVTVGQGALLGVGVSVAPSHSVGEWAVVGAGAAVVRDIPGGVTAKGVPARW